MNILVLIRVRIVFVKILKNRTLILISLLFLNIVFYYYAYSDGGKLKVVFLDVGQGDAIFIQSPTGNQLLIDSGNGVNILAKLGQAMPFFDRSIDAVLATHPDQDHIGGFPDILKFYKVGKYFQNGAVYSTATAKEVMENISSKKIENIILCRGMVLNIGGGAYQEILWPLICDSDKKSSDTNSSSIVAKLVYGENSILLTGDAPQKTEKALISLDPFSLKSDILKVGHHGSKNSSSEDFLRAVSSTEAVISVGLKNSYGHPNIEVINQLKNIGEKISETSLLGNVVFYSDGMNIIKE